MSQYNNGKTSYFRTSDLQHDEKFNIYFGKGIVVKDAGANDTIITSGPILKNVMLACADLPVNILYFHTLKPFDNELIENYKHTRFLVVQDAHGLFEAVCETPDIKVTRHGLQDKFIGSYGTADEIRRDIQLDPEGIRNQIQSRLHI